MAVARQVGKSLPGRAPLAATLCVGRGRGLVEDASRPVASRWRRRRSSGSWTELHRRRRLRHPLERADDRGEGWHRAVVGAQDRKVRRPETDFVASTVASSRTSSPGGGCGRPGHTSTRAVLSVGEKSQIPGARPHPAGLPMKKGRAGTMTHDYKRHGTTTLFAALNVSPAWFRHCMPRTATGIPAVSEADRQGDADRSRPSPDPRQLRHPAEVRHWLAAHPRHPPRGRQEVEDAEAAPADDVRHDPAGIPGEVGLARRLSDGGAELRGAAVRVREADRPRSEDGRGEKGRAQPGEESSRHLERSFACLKMSEPCRRRAVISGCRPSRIAAFCACNFIRHDNRLVACEFSLSRGLSEFRAHPPVKRMQRRPRAAEKQTPGASGKTEEQVNLRASCFPVSHHATKRSS